MILRDNDEEHLIKLTLFATRDFIMEIMSFGEDVKVVGPEGLVMEVKRGFEGALKKYV